MFKIIILLVVSLHFKQWNCFRLPKNVCSTFIDYHIMPFSENCWHDPDVGSTPYAIANRYCYQFESHSTVTEDGYQLGLFRIPPRNKNNRAQIVFLQHGILETAMSWLSLGNKSLAFKLSNSGFDVWMGNFRGTIYSNEHKVLNIQEKEYWDFSFYELGYYDLEAMFEYVANVTKTKKKIIYIGHSLGSTTSYVYSIIRREEASERLAALISLAPVAYMKHTHIKFGLLAKISSQLDSFSQIIKMHAIGMSTNDEETIFHDLCLYGVTKHICRNIALLVIDLFSSSVAPEKLPILLTQAPAATSLKVLRHFAQEILNDGQFQGFDFGNLNRKKYGSSKPPAFDVSQINLPVYLIYGDKDKVADEQDVKKLFVNLNSPKKLISVADFDHLDFVYSKRIEKLYKPLFEVLKETDL